MGNSTKKVVTQMCGWYFSGMPFMGGMSGGVWGLLSLIVILVGGAYFLGTRAKRNH
ncbi:hypothetical protein [Lactiplantibacillus modestisalitolerans]|uniref:LPXTG cell wall anchor domain-containing protein n=1 Tax=Lactiplantibacillus modestisalitolerans TaxID=1457219 RepID=A0ABV5WW18_9LACO|nr:hypothetical protein [Lactiplantibacillus modestisalitolerans]